MSPYFSVILPIYNVEAYLDRCVQSVLGQDFRDFELILVDDGSPDGCPALCDRYAREHACIRVVHKPNGGLSSARNAGMEIARGKYIWWVDSDDWIEPGALGLVHRMSCDREPDVVKFSHNRIEAEKEIIRSIAPAGYFEGEGLQELMNIAFSAAGRYVLSVWSSIYRREFLEQHSLRFVSEREIGSEDYLFNFQVYLHAQRMQVLPEALYNYEQRGGSLTQTYKKDLAERYNRLHAQLCAYYRGHGALEAYEGRLCRFYLWHLMIGTCVPHEYRATKNHTTREGRINLRRIFRMPEFQYAVRRGDRSGMNLRRRVQLLAMRWRIEPLFYWLYVVKPGMRGREKA